MIYLRFQYYPRWGHRPIVNVSVLTSLIRYIYYLYTVIIKTKVYFVHALVRKVWRYQIDKSSIEKVCVVFGMYLIYKERQLNIVLKHVVWVISHI